MTARRPESLLAIDREMARQHADTIASFAANKAVAEKVAASIRTTGRLLMIGMGGSHAVSRAVEPLYRALGIDAVSLPMSEQLAAPLPIAGRTIIVTSQSGESAEVVRWFKETGGTADTFGMTLEAGSFLGKAVPSLIAAGGSELAFAATRSLTLTFALHLAVLAELGLDPAPALAVLKAPETPDTSAALIALKDVRNIVASGRSLQGVAEAIALGFTELSRRPCFSHEGGQLRHGPMEMLSPEIGVVLFRAKDATSPLIASMGREIVATGAPVIVFDASGDEPLPGAVTVAVKPASGLAAIFALLPAAQTLMVAFAEERVENAGTPVRSNKVTRSE